ncbi:MAG: Gfo/Idh/MocA family oxidoreductase [Thermoguttaceae bacterium]|nr:Gfo/Idh/MocA family oxidoreductase [Thermoguttaceae bacterium]
MMRDTPVLTSRRLFLRLAALGIAAPHVVPRLAAGADSPNEKLGVGCIGVGGRGSYVGSIACELGNRVAAADVDRHRAERFAGGGPCAAYTDYRQLLDRDDVDVVTIGTPDHWHTRICIDAMKAGKDVYCEKPLTLTIDEGKKLCRVVRETGRMLQVGTQQRASAQFLLAVAIARSGRLGKQIKATCGIGGGPGSGVFPTADPPEHLNWDVWLGQCPVVPYTPERCHGNFRWWLEYSGGKMTDWGAHHVDIAQWALGFDHFGPVEAEGRGQFPNFPDDVDPVEFFAGRVKLPNGFNAATTFDVTLTFANGSSLVTTPGENGILLEGEEGRILVNRGRITGKPIEELTAADRQRLGEEVVRLYKGRPIDPEAITTDATNTGRDQATPDLMANFFASVRDRQQPISDAFTHHRGVSSCHLSNIAMLLRRKLRWDPEQEDFIGDAQASALVSRPQREPYAI